MATCDGVRPISVATAITVSASRSWMSLADGLRRGSVDAWLYLPVSVPAPSSENGVKASPNALAIGSRSRSTSRSARL